MGAYAQEIAQVDLQAFYELEALSEKYVEVVELMDYGVSGC